MSAGGVINIYTPQYEKLTFDVSAPSYYSLSFHPNRCGNTNIIKTLSVCQSLMKMAQVTCQDEGNISAILNQTCDMPRPARRETMLVRTLFP